MGRLGTYEVIGVLGRGGMGVVLKAFDPALNRNIAIKVLSAALASCGAARRRFLREARAAAAVVHEHVVSVFAVEEIAGLPILVMEYVPGRSLQDRLDKTGPLTLPEILRIGMQTASGLAAAHAQGLVHRDVKPANILLEKGVERVRLSDFGLARAAADAAVTQSGVIAGTPHYMAPEQARGETSDHRSDLFSLGSTLYTIARPSAVPCRVAARRAAARQRRPSAPLREINHEVPEWLEAIIAKLHAKDPSERIRPLPWWRSCWGTAWLTSSSRCRSRCPLKCYPARLGTAPVAGAGGIRQSHYACSLPSAARPWRPTSGARGERAHRKRRFSRRFRRPSVRLRSPPQAPTQPTRSPSKSRRLIVD